MSAVSRFSILKRAYFSTVLGTLKGQHRFYKQDQSDSERRISETHMSLNSSNYEFSKLYTPCMAVCQEAVLTTTLPSGCSPTAKSKNVLGLLDMMQIDGQCRSS